ncbi:2213_t:CDS:10 [Ambispora leptoticha]|uniref:Probable methionine--tRNA ligase, mitochondrial n=1 Tax=Ambispora leptoticha TaxID=144679 RepID=A0A9N9AR50_9GLOM|nr:2213_t:CDS:10 [Ambispora leptoticha]
MGVKKVYTIITRKTNWCIGQTRKFTTKLPEKPTYISTPIFYVNAKPHIGHLYSVVLADSIKRYHELKGHNVILSTGTDEHGLKIQQAASANRKSPQEFCDEDLFNRANISYSKFIRTTDERHKEAVQVFWDRLVAGQYIYKDVHEGWYSVSDEAFYPESQIRAFTDPSSGENYMVSIESEQRVVWMKEENYKFRLSILRDKILQWLEEKPSVIVPEFRVNEVKGWLESGLTDLSISRASSRVGWGISVPGDPEQTIYVWLDALINYLTVTGFPWSNDTRDTMLSNGWPADLHVVGKDILRFHALYWPAFLIAANIPLPRKILAHSHWTMGKQKMSKSRGNVVDPFQLLDLYGVDAMRYYLMRDGGIADDGDYSEDWIQERYRKELAGQLGNLLSRCTSATVNPSQHIPPKPAKSTSEDIILHQKLIELPDLIDQCYDEAQFRKALDLITNTLAEANKYISDNQPWILVKDPGQAELFDEERRWDAAKFGKGWPDQNNLSRHLGTLEKVLFPPLRK